MTDQERRIQHFPRDWANQNLPGLTRLMQNGLTFENAFTNACMCSPARSTFMLDVLDDWTRQRQPVFRLRCACQQDKVHRLDLRLACHKDAG
jgi:hypothetical protein